jgi:hypothetical protein
LPVNRHHPGQKNLYTCKEIHITFYTELAYGEKRTDEGKYPIWCQDSLESFSHESEIAASFVKTIAGTCNKKEWGISNKQKDFSKFTYPLLKKFPQYRT